MKHRGKKIITGVLICILSVAMCNITFAHSGKTDSSGGHKDNKNKSGLGSYHYHCGGHPAHLHTNGVCPYSSNKSKTTSKSSSSSSATKSSTTHSNSQAKNTIEAESIKINDTVKEIKVGDSKQLSANILPEDTTDKEIIWETSDENVIKISSTGEITAIGEGRAYITASTSNKKINSSSRWVTKEKQEKNDSSENSNSLGTIISLGVLGGSGYLGYKKHKKVNNKE